MKPAFASALLAAMIVGGSPILLAVQQLPAADLRAPASPLIVHDPYFSIWSNSDKLTGGPTRHWTGARQQLNGIIRIDGKSFRYLGEDSEIPALEETARKITATRTIVTLQNPQIELRVCFFTPAFPDDMRVMARPVSYLTWEVKSRDRAQHDVALYLDVDGAIATNTRGEPVLWSRDRIGGLDLLSVGSQKQPMLEQYGDDLRINWGYFYLAVPDSEGKASLAAGNESDRDRFVSSGELPVDDDLDQPRMPQSNHPPSPTLNLAMPLGKVGDSSVIRHVLLSYNDTYSVEYMHQRLLPYWRKEFPSFASMLQAAERDYIPLTTRAEQYDSELEH